MTQDYKKEILQRITKNLLDIQLLRLVETQSTWGYKIKKNIENNLNIKLRHAALYPTLNQLEKKGFLISQMQQEKGRARKVYAITEKGREYLESYYTVIQEQIKN